MTTYTADRMASGVEPVQNATGDVCVIAVFSLTAALAANDIIQMMKLPALAYVSDVVLATDALDTNVASTIAYDIGDSNSAARYVSDKAQGNNAALPPYHLDQKGGLGYQIGTNTGDNTIQVKVHTGPATGATSGQVVLAVTYSMQSKTPTTGGQN